MSEKSKLKNNIWKYYLASGLGGLAFFYNAIGTLYYRHFNVSFAQIGWLISITLIVTVILEIPSGAFADLYGKKKSLIISAILNFIATFLVTTSSSFWPFLIGFAFWGAGRAFNSGAASAFLFDTLKALGQEKAFIKHSGRLSGLFTSIDIFSGFLGPLMFATNIRFPFYISLVAAFLVVLVQFTFYEHTKVDKTFTKILTNHWQQIKDTFLIGIKSKIFIWLTLVSILFFITGKTMAEIVSTPFLTKQAGFSLQNLSFIFLIASIIQASAAFFADKIEAKLGPKSSFLFASLIFGLTTFVLGLSRNVLLTAFILGFYYAAWSFNDVVVQNYLSHHSLDQNRATLLSISSMLVSLSGLLTFPMMGLITDLISTQITIWILGIILLLFSPLLIIFYPKTNHA